MARHFLGLYLLVVVTLAVVSWGQDRLFQIYSKPDSAENRPVATLMAVLADRLRDAPPESWRSLIAGVAGRTGFFLRRIRARRPSVQRDTPTSLSR